MFKYSSQRFTDAAALSHRRRLSLHLGSYAVPTTTPGGTSRARSGCSRNAALWWTRTQSSVTWMERPCRRRAPSPPGPVSRANDMNGMARRKAVAMKRHSRVTTKIERLGVVEMRSIVRFLSWAASCTKLVCC
uniref:Uncharacterized protein n=1 Tax=Setaria viridis TaxID=4556 RepID=A0A4V6D344_SETVI|nr:hypothetical protein SEVIR_8G141800v2 [Setaria viridis]